MNKETATVAIEATKHALSESDASSYEKLNDTIAKGLRTFLKVGKALNEVKERRLYKLEFGTWEEYLEKRHGISKSYACRSIQAASTVLELEKRLPIGNLLVLPTNESQVRELRRLPTEEERIEAWTKAVEAVGGKVPAAAVVEQEVVAIRSRSASVKVTKPRGKAGTFEGDGHAEEDRASRKDEVTGSRDVPEVRADHLPCGRGAPPDTHRREFLVEGGQESKPAVFHDGSEEPDALRVGGYIDHDLAQRKLDEIAEWSPKESSLGPWERTALQRFFVGFVKLANRLHDEYPTMTMRNSLRWVFENILRNLFVVAAKPGDVEGPSAKSE
jgi:hypothetical protein